jgi:tetratricopeptide (TPR) repeat protein
METAPRHVRIIGERTTDRLQLIDESGPHRVVARCHRGLRGPYTGVDAVLAEVLPDAAAHWPDLVEAHRVELLYGIPELERLIGPAPETLASASPFQERTRFFGLLMIRCMNQGIVTFLLRYAKKVLERDGVALSVAFDEAHAAEPTTTEFLALLVRRADPALLRVVVGGVDGSWSAELDSVAARFCDHLVADPTPRAAESRTDAELARAFVASDGTSDDPAELAAYEQADAELLARLHDERAAELEPDAGWSLRTGAIPYHHEHGSDPTGRGRLALHAAMKRCAEIGFCASIVDFGLRGRPLCDPDEHQQQFCSFTIQVASALISFGRMDESLQMYLSLKQRYVLPRVHMHANYGIAMLYTRFFTPRDHELALAYQNDAVALAGVSTDPVLRTTDEVFQRNGLALVEMHRGNLARSLELVTSGIERMNATLPPDRFVVHRSQLLYNKARVMVALGHLDEALADFDTLVEWDPYYTDYFSERAKISRKRGDFEAALADYDRAVSKSPPFPELYYNRGTARLAVGDEDGALADFGYVLEMEPDDVDTRLSRADLLLGRGDLDAAEADVLVGLETRPEEPRLLCTRGVIALERGDNTAAKEWFDQALAIDPTYPAALINRAVASFEDGDPQSAVDDLTSVVDLVGDDPDVLYNRGLAYQAAGRRDLAVLDFEHALRLPDADVEELRRCLGELVQV